MEENQNPTSQTVNQTPPAPAVQTPSNIPVIKPKSKLPIAIIIGIMLLLLVVFGVSGFYLFKKSQIKPTPVPTVAVQASPITTADPTEKKTFSFLFGTSNELGFTFKYPASWVPDGRHVLYIRDSDDPINFDNYDPNELRGAYIYLQTPERIDSAGINTPEYQSAYQSSQSIMLDDIEAKMSQFVTEGHYTDVVMTRRNGEYYRIMFQTKNQDLHDKYKNDFDELIRSLKFSAPLDQVQPPDITEQILASAFLEKVIEYLSENKKYPCDFPQTANSRPISELSICLDNLNVATLYRDNPHLKYIIISFDPESKVLQACFNENETCESKTLSI